MDFLVFVILRIKLARNSPVIDCPDKTYVVALHDVDVSVTCHRLATEEELDSYLFMDTNVLIHDNLRLVQKYPCTQLDTGPSGKVYQEAVDSLIREIKEELTKQELSPLSESILSDNLYTTKHREPSSCPSPTYSFKYVIFDDYFSSQDPSPEQTLS